MNLYRYALAVFLVAIVFIFNGCNKDEDPAITPVVLSDATLFGSVDVADIKSFISSKKLPIPATDIKYSVDIYKVDYKTNYKGDVITASGLVALPKTSQAVGMLSFQHGTISAHRDAPTAASPGDDIVTFYAAIASVGFVGVVPDFIGFGSSSNMMHPYYVEEPTASAVLDNIRAARELALTHDVKLNKKLFLAGYSQGGYATLAAHKAIETGDKVEGLNLVASFPSSGGYSVKGMQEYFFGLETYQEPFYLGFVAMAYKTHYGWTQSMNILFNEPYATKIPQLFDGSKSGSQINAELTVNVKSLVKPSLLTGIDQDPQYKFISDAFTANSLTDFTPKVPIYFYHGTLDTTVPYQNSVDVYNTFIANGASPSVVTFTPLGFATHSTGVTPYIIELTNKLLALK
jgi:pimeloyl-ACP methyl ester carboxylesterase